MTTHHPGEPGTPDEPTDASDALFVDVQRAMRELAAHMGAYTQAVGDRVGLAATDVNLLGFINDIGPSATGLLAERTGLTPGAITRAIDRLEEGGYVERSPDPDDRRRVIVSLTPLTERTLQPIFDNAFDSATGAMESFDDQKLRLVLDFTGKASTILHEATARLREGPGPGDPGLETTATAPLGNLRRAQLSLHVGGGVPVAVRVDNGLGGQLFRVEATGVAPVVDVRGGKVRVTVRGRRRRSKQTAVTVAVHPSVSWSVELHGNGGRLDARLAAARLDALVVHGNHVELDVSLPPPAKRSVSVKVHGNGIEGRFRCEPHIPVIAALRGRGHAFVVDGSPIPREEGSRALVWESEHFSRGAPHYVLAAHGDGSNLHLDRS